MLSIKKINIFENTVKNFKKNLRCKTKILYFLKKVLFHNKIFCSPFKYLGIFMTCENVLYIVLLILEENKLNNIMVKHIISYKNRNYK